MYAGPRSREEGLIRNVFRRDGQVKGAQACPAWEARLVPTAASIVGDEDSGLGRGGVDSLILGIAWRDGQVVDVQAIQSHCQVFPDQPLGPQAINASIDSAQQQAPVRE